MGKTTKEHHWVNIWIGEKGKGQRDNGEQAQRGYRELETFNTE